MVSKRDLTRYGGAVGGVALAVMARIALSPVLGDAYPLMTLFFAVVATAVLAGFGPTLVAIVLGLIAADYLFLPPFNAFGLVRPQDAIGLGVFVALGLMTATLSRRAAQSRHLAGEVAERRQAEAQLQENRERLQAALTASGTGTFRWDIRTNTLDWDESLDRLFGLPPGRTARSLDQFVSLVYPDDRAEVVRRCERCAAEGADFAMDFRVIWPDGSLHWLADRGQTHLAPDGRPLYMTGACVDITDRKHMEEALREEDRRKDNFIATLAHELRNPLAPVRNAVQVLNMTGDDQTSRKAREILERQVGQMTRLVDDLLDVSRIRQGKISMRRERVGLRSVIQMAVETCRPQIEGAGHELKIELPPDDLELEGDPARLAQVLSNLLSNAAKYMDHGGSIRLSVTEEGGQAVIRVEDRGVGIPADLLERVFDPFVQVDRSLHRSQGGLGIGLALVRSLVAMQGGTVEACSEGPGQGSAFVVRLPLASPVPAVAAVTATPLG